VIQLVALSLLLMSKLLWGAPVVPLLKISDTINPGTADFIINEIRFSNERKDPLLILQLDTPGGLLTSTRQIIQSMLNSTTPIVVWVGPRGAQAGSAGALITFAADVAVMATGSNIGAAHPVQGGGQPMDKTLSDKLTNDTAAFAEGLAKTKGRNTEWARQAVTESRSIPSDEALRLNVIDFIADDIQSLEQKLLGYQLKTPKGSLSQLSSTPFQPQEHSPTLKQQVVSFFANPSLAYLILALGGLCIWIELSHPGLILPGVLGGLCVLISLVSFQLLPIRFGALGLLLFGMALLIAELFATSYGILGIGGILSFILGSLFLMDTNVPEFQIPLNLVLSVSTCLALAIFALSYLVLKTYHLKIKEHYLSLIGLSAQATEDITPSSGTAFIQGELWKARTCDGQEVKKGNWFEVKEVKGLVLIVQKKETP